MRVHGTTPADRWKSCFQWGQCDHDNDQPTGDSATSRGKGHFRAMRISSRDHG